jgi:hypothetical protein
VAYAATGQWGQRYALHAGKPAALHDCRQLAADGEITIWGKRRPNGVFEAVPKEFWLDNQVDALALMRGDARTQIAAPGVRSDITFTDLMTKRAHFEREFPDDYRR